MWPLPQIGENAKAGLSMMPVGQPEDRATVGTDPSAALPLEQVALPLAATLPKVSAFATLKPTRQTGKRNRQPYYFSFFFFVEVLFV